MKSSHAPSDGIQNTGAMKAILMILIVFYHSCVFYGGEWISFMTPSATSSGLKYFCSYLNSFLVYAFVLISGYIFYFLKFEKLKYDRFGPFVLAKFKRLIVPYFAISLLYIPIEIFFGEFSLSSFGQNYLLGTSPAQLWFLLMLFWVFWAAFYLADRWKNHSGQGIIIVLVFYAAGIVGGKALPNYFQIWSACKYLLFFFLGFKIRQGWDSYIKKIPFWCYILFSLSGFGLVTVAERLNDGILTMGLHIALSLTLNIVGAIMMWTTLQFITNRIKMKESGLWNCFTKTSMTVYLLHQQIIYFVIYFLNGKVNLYLNAFLNFLISLGVSLVLAFVLLKSNPARILLGEKPKKPKK